ncbi:MAG: Gfo/Idh/MocA family oxidoreductase [Planctomycetota bacterium]|nr:Gfo/Idh/MocA family oxidoreductase [Planctomycetota bacterium]
MPEKIRVGLIRCDTHGAYYAPLMDEHDPLKLQMPVPMGEPARDSWQRGGAHFYFYTHYSDPTRIMVETVDGFELTKLWDDQDRRAAEVLSEVFYGKPKVCDSLDEVSDDVDLVFIADCNYEGHDHLELASPGLEKGIPTFIDKPMAYTLADCKAILDLAEKNNAPVTSISILRALPAAAQFAKRMPEVGELASGTIHGGGQSLAGHIHAISLAQHVFGNGVKSVRAMGETPLGIIHLNYDDQPDRPSRGVTITCDTGPGWHCAFFASAYGSNGAIHSPALSDFEFPFGAAEILKIIKTMVHTGTTPEITYDMVEGIAIAEAARKAQASGESVLIER